jgi:hypothetical protein
MSSSNNLGAGISQANVKAQTGRAKFVMMSQGQATGAAGTVPARVGWGREWQRWAPYAAVAWSLVYTVLGVYWAGGGFPYAPEIIPDVTGPVAGRFGSGVAWIVVIMAGIPAVAMGTLMLREVRILRPLLISAGALLAGSLLLLMTDLTLLTTIAYIPFGVYSLLTGAEFGQIYLEELTRWAFLHQLLCLIGGFLWLAATVSYARRSVDACLYCGRRDGLEGWNSPANAKRWGRLAVYVAVIIPVLYALTRYAWALGIPLGMSKEYLRLGQERGTWTAGLFLANFGLVGAALTLGLAQRWGEVFPRWMFGLAGRRVPIALAVVPASIVSVLFMVGGITLWSGYAQLADAAAATGQDLGIVVGPALLLPIWGVALAVATLGYYYRRRGPCGKCGRGAPGKAGEPLASPNPPDGRLPATG